MWLYVLNKGISTAKDPFNLVLELKIECHEHDVYLHMLHISRECIIAIGKYGLSQGNRGT